MNTLKVLLQERAAKVVEDIEALFEARYPVTQSLTQKT